jgi:uncharacterized protein
MTTFQAIAILLALIWLVLVVGWFRRSSVVLLGGLLLLGLGTLAALAAGMVSLAELGLRTPPDWLPTLGVALAGLVLLLAYSPLADRLAGRFFAKPPTLQAFGALKQSPGKLILGILLAWVLGGFLEELVARGIILTALAGWLGRSMPLLLADALAVLLAGVGAGLMHTYQGPRAVLIITQLSLLFGLLFVLSGFNLWAVMLCHGLYDTIAFVRFATGRSKYGRAVAGDLPGEKQE